MRKLIFIAVAIAALSGCEKMAETSTQAGVEFKVDRLFTTDGCTVYRFSDAGRNRYFTNCHGSTEWQEQSGKTTYPDGVQGGRP